MKACADDTFLSPFFFNVIIGWKIAVSAAAEQGLRVFCELLTLFTVREVYEHFRDAKKLKLVKIMSFQEKRFVIISPGETTWFYFFSTYLTLSIVFLGTRLKLLTLITLISIFKYLAAR